MGCGCNKQKKNLPPVLEIVNEPYPVQFLTLEQEGTLAQHPAVIGKYRNVLVVYRDSMARVMYDSQGIPTVLTTDTGGEGVDDFNDLKNRPKYMGSMMTGGTDIPEVPAPLSDEDYNNLWT